jgi:hypothetical protein
MNIANSAWLVVKNLQAWHPSKSRVRVGWLPSGICIIERHLHMSNRRRSGSLHVAMRWATLLKATYHWWNLILYHFNEHKNCKLRSFHEIIIHVFTCFVHLSPPQIWLYNRPFEHFFFFNLRVYNLSLSYLSCTEKKVDSG